MFGIKYTTSYVDNKHYYTAAAQHMPTTQPDTHKYFKCHDGVDVLTTWIEWFLWGKEENKTQNQSV